MMTSCQRVRPSFSTVVEADAWPQTRGEGDVRTTMCANNGRRLTFLIFSHSFASCTDRKSCSVVSFFKKLSTGYVHAA